MNKIIIICSAIFLFMLAACHMTKETSGSKSNSKDAVKTGETTNTRNSKKNDFSKPKYRKVLRQRERILKRSESDKRFIFF